MHYGITVYISPIAELGMAHSILFQITHWLYAGPFQGKMFLLVEDTHSKSMEMVIFISKSEFENLLQKNGRNTSL